MNRLKARITTGAVAACLAFTNEAAQAGYVITNLGTLGGASHAYGVNDAGQVVGSSDALSDGTTKGGSSHAFLYSGGAMSDLGTFGSASSAAQGVNSAGDVVGWHGGLKVAIGSLGRMGFQYQAGVQTDLGTLGGDGSIAYAINDAGQVVGVAEIEDPVVEDGEDGTKPAQKKKTGIHHAFLYESGMMIDLGTLGGDSSAAYGINSLGQVVGWASNTDGTIHAFVYDGMSMSSLGTLGGAYSEAYAINDAGQVVGIAQTAAGQEHAFLYSDSVMQDLGTLGGTFSLAYAINSSGDIVGSSNLANFESRAFLYTGGTMMDLNDLLPAGSGWVLHEARGINSSGQIVGTGVFNGETRAFLLTPSSLSSVPEPSTVVLLGTGILGLAGSLRRRRRAKHVFAA